MKMQASSAKFLSEVMTAHKSKGMFMLSESQCERKLAGKI